ncbi:MAG: hypothetical protein AB2809_20370 [Candidatus Thiodiazotropha sp.]
MNKFPTKQEIEREWMDLQQVEACSGGEYPHSRKLIRNWTDRGLVQIKNPNPGTNEKRLYSLKNAIELSVMRDMVSDGKTVRTARIIADKAIKYVYQLIKKRISLDELDIQGHILIYMGTLGTSGAKYFVVEPDKIVEWLTKPQSDMFHVTGSPPMNFHVYHIDYSILRCIQTYQEIKG